MRTHGFGLQALIEVGRRHWREYLQKRYRSLKETGMLESALATAADLTIKEMDSLKSGMAMNQYEAWEAAREHYLILKEERPERPEPMPPNPAFEALVAANKIPIYPEDEEQ
jgi:hypothetical protein